MTTLDWSAKKAAYRVFNTIPKKRTKQQKADLERNILEAYQAHGVPEEANQPYYVGNVIYGYFAFN